MMVSTVYILAILNKWEPQGSGATFSGHSLPSSIHYINTAAVSEGVLFNCLFKAWNSNIFEILQYLNSIISQTVPPPPVLSLSLSRQPWCHRASVTYSHHNAHSRWRGAVRKCPIAFKVRRKCQRNWLHHHEVKGEGCGWESRDSSVAGSASRSSRPAPSNMSVNKGVLEGVSTATFLQLSPFGALCNVHVGCAQ